MALTDIRIYLRTVTLDGGEHAGKTACVFTKCIAEHEHLEAGGTKCGKILAVDDKAEEVTILPEKLSLLIESGCSMTRARFTPNMIVRQNEQFQIARAAASPR
jgi:hypothetical protein